MPSDRHFRAQPLAPLRYLAVWFLNLLMRSLVLLPWRWQIRLCSFGGALLRQLAPGRKRVVDTNLRLCFPELGETERERIARAHFRALGASLAEMAMGWYGPVERVRELVEIEGLEHVDAALESGRSAILFSGHFTCFEIVFPALRVHCTRIAGMYKPQRNELMNQIMTAGRLRNVDRVFSKDDARGMLRELSTKTVFWYAADQSYTSKGAALIPFLGEPAMTNTAISRIARISGAAVLPYFSRRLPDWQGYRLTIHPALDDFPTDDPVADTRRLIESLESFVRECPEQYWWIHKRFKGRPPPLPDVYASRPGTDAARNTDD